MSSLLFLQSVEKRKKCKEKGDFCVRVKQMRKNSRLDILHWTFRASVVLCDALTV